MFIEDLHTHTSFSPDGDKAEENTLYGKARLAKQKGLSYIAFTDHYDFDGSRGLLHDIDAAKEAVCAAKRDFKDQNFCPLWSIELANVNEFRNEANEILEKYKFDFVLASLHMTTGEQDACRMKFDDKDKYPAKRLTEIVDTYLDEVYNICKTFDFDSIAHIGYPLRYMKRYGRINELDLRMFDGKLKQIFKLLISRDKCMEINTSGLRQGYDDTLPSQRAIEMYYELGGRNVTIGSDSHDAATVAADVLQVKQLLKKIGFTYTCAFENRKKIEIPLV